MSTTPDLEEKVSFCYNIIFETSTNFWSPFFSYPALLEFSYLLGVYTGNLPSFLDTYFPHPAHLIEL